ncbi:hypothetical protein PV736_42050, partial [Streptomyces scabiei]
MPSSRTWTAPPRVWSSLGPPPYRPPPGTPPTDRRRRNVSSPRTDRFLDIRRDPHSDELLARGRDSEAHSILQRAGFIAVVRLHETYHRAPTGLTEDDESRLATDAVARLRTAGYHVDCAPDFDTDAQPTSYLPLGFSVAHLAERLRNATTTDEAADALTELTAAHDGILAAPEEVLTATADFHDGRPGCRPLHRPATALPRPRAPPHHPHRPRPRPHRPRRPAHPAPRPQHLHRGGSHHRTRTLRRVRLPAPRRARSRP